MVTKVKPYVGIRLSRKAAVPQISFINLDESRELIAILQGQDLSYTCADYLSSSYSNRSVTVALEHDADANCREKMIEWCYRVCDCGIFPPCDREMVAIAMSYLDRFMMNLCTACDRPTFKLAAVTSFYLATKIMSCMQIRIESLVDLGRGSFNGNDVLQMEQTLLHVLEWKMNPPTIQCFIRQIWTLLPMPLRENTSIYYRAIFFAELSVYEYEFVTKDRYMIAVACILVATQSQVHHDTVNTKNQVDIATLSMDAVERKGLGRIQSRLWYLYSCSAQLSEEVVKPVVTVVLPPKYSLSHRTLKSQNDESKLLSSHSPVSVQDDDNEKLNCK